VNQGHLLLVTVPYETLLWRTKARRYLPFSRDRSLGFQRFRWAFTPTP